LASRIKDFIQYALLLALAAFLVWFSLQGIQVAEGQNKWDYIYQTWRIADKGWLSLMVLFFFISHIIRAERWRMLLSPAGHPTTLYRGFISLMIGYLVNLVIPRGGEISRCYNLYKLDKTPVEISFGTVVVERIVDLFALFIVLVLAFALEFEKLMAFIGTLPIQPFLVGGKAGTLLLFTLFMGILVAIVYLVIKKNHRIRDRIVHILIGFKKGLYSVSKVANKPLFILYSVSIWIMYFMMSYAVIKAFSETSDLGMTAVLSLFAIGTIAMAAPLPGGAGSYHVLIPAGLVFLYQLPQASAVAFTFVFHGWQTLITILGGVLSLILSSALLRKIAKQKF
jgi:glycosyltransferase 2 family protein